MSQYVRRVVMIESFELVVSIHRFICRLILSVVANADKFGGNGFPIHIQYTGDVIMYQAIVVVIEILTLILYIAYMNYAFGGLDFLNDFKEFLDRNTKVIKKLHK